MRLISQFEMSTRYRLLGSFLEHWLLSKNRQKHSAGEFLKTWPHPGDPLKSKSGIKILPLLILQKSFYLNKADLPVSQQRQYSFYIQEPLNVNLLYHLGAVSLTMVMKMMMILIKTLKAPFALSYFSWISLTVYDKTLLSSTFHAWRVFFFFFLNEWLSSCYLFFFLPVFPPWGGL